MDPSTVSEALDFATYMNSVATTIQLVFQRVVPPAALSNWLRPMAFDDARRAMLMHEEPLYIAADFLNIDRTSPDFAQYEEKYGEVRFFIVSPLSGDY